MFGKKKKNMVVFKVKNGLKNKMSGTTEFKRNEMIQIKKEFPDCSLDYLFATENEKGA